MGIPLLAGRLFDQRDVMSRPNVTVISKALAEMYFPGGNALGKQVSFAFPPDPGIPRQVVGIVGDVRDVSLGDAPKPMVYVPFTQAPYPGAVVVVKSPLSVASVAATLRHYVAKIDKDLPVSDIRVDARHSERVSGTAQVSHIFARTISHDGTGAGGDRDFWSYFLFRGLPDA